MFPGGHGGSVENRWPERPWGTCLWVCPVEQDRSLPHWASSQGLTSLSVPTGSCFSMSSFVSFPSSDSDSEGDNPEKKKLQEQLMGKRPEAPQRWEGTRRGTPKGELGGLKSGSGSKAPLVSFRCRCDGEAQHPVE